jgi:polyhydroxyalkanoate synthesis regulator phasin
LETSTEGVVHRTDLQEMGERIEALTEKVESLRRFL